MTEELIREYRKSVNDIVKEVQIDLNIKNGKHIAVNNVYSAESEFLWEEQIVLTNKTSFQILVAVGVRDIEYVPIFVAKYFYKDKKIERFI